MGRIGAGLIKIDNIRIQLLSTDKEGDKTDGE